MRLLRASRFLRRLLFSKSDRGLAPDPEIEFDNDVDGLAADASPPQQLPFLHGSPPELSDGELEDLIEQIKDWQITHGSLIKLVQSAEPHTVLSRPIGVSVFPTPFPRSCFEEALDLQKTFNALYAAIAEDEAWLGQVLSGLIATDPFTQQLWKIHQTVKHEGVVQSLTLGIFRSDYMLHVPDTENSAFTDCQLKQVEFNTFSVAGASHAEIAAKMHHRLHQNGVPGAPEEWNLPSEIENNLSSIIDGLRAADDAYGPQTNKEASGKGILFIVQPNNINICDERPIEYGMDQIFRLVFGQPVLSCTRLGPNRELLYQHPGPSSRLLEISVVYMRAGYDAEEYDKMGIEARLRLERSRAIKCPSILGHLATFKKVQQALAAPGALEQFLTIEQARAVRKTFMPMYTLDDSDKGLLLRAVAVDRELAAGYVLKPSLEGGGHNVYGSDITHCLRTMPGEQWKNYILMELIHSPIIHNILMSPRGFYNGPVISELGILGVVLWREKGSDEDDAMREVEVLKNNNAGWTFKTKAVHINEMSVVKGYGCFDCPILIASSD